MCEKPQLANSSLTKITSLKWRWAMIFPASRGIYSGSYRVTFCRILCVWYTNQRRRSLFSFAEVPLCDIWPCANFISNKHNWQNGWKIWRLHIPALSFTFPFPRNTLLVSFEVWKPLSSVINSLSDVDCLPLNKLSKISQNIK